MTPYWAELQRVELGHQQARGHMELHGEWTREQQAQAVVNSSSMQALVWSLIGLVTCCFPIACVVGVVQGVRSWMLARKRGLTKPASGVAGLILGLAGLTLSAVMWAWFGYDMMQQQMEKERIQKRIARGALAEKLDQRTACDLLKLEIIDTNYEGAYVWSGYKCDGRLEQDGPRAVLHDAKVSVDNKMRPVFGCFSRGERWFVQEIRPDADCQDAAAKPAGDAAAAPVDSGTESP
jgi:hypothetical protein